ncbi:MAG: hypothetical protein J6W64_06580 [Bacilli bacterium]|nr:hypothetical protein [Bacilli bacterium]
MKKELFARISFILGIVAISFSLIECIIPLIIIGMVVGAAGIVFGFISLKSEKKEFAISGIILSIGAIIVASIWLYLALIA